MRKRTRGISNTAGKSFGAIYTFPPVLFIEWDGSAVKHENWGQIEDLVNNGGCWIFERKWTHLWHRYVHACRMPENYEGRRRKHEISYSESYLDGLKKYKGVSFLLRPYWFALDWSISWKTFKQPHLIIVDNVLRLNRIKGQREIKEHKNVESIKRDYLFFSSPRQSNIHVPSTCSVYWCAVVAVGK